MVPAAGQGAIALQVRSEEAASYAGVLDQPTARAVTIERLFLAQLGEGCHTAFACHVKDNSVMLFREDFGRHEFPMLAKNAEEALPRVAEILRTLKS
jgi:hydroxymethylbilane synthase